MLGLWSVQLSQVGVGGAWVGVAAMPQGSESAGSDGVKGTIREADDIDWESSTYAG
jgi:hypothetical protein